MGKRDKDTEWSGDRFTATAQSLAKSGDSVTKMGEEQVKQSGNLDPLVDPRTHDGRRESLDLLIPCDNGFVLRDGVAMPVKDDLDCTGSMGTNVATAFKVLPQRQYLLNLSKNAVLRRYNVQMATGVVQDQHDRFPYEHTEFEPDNEIERQLRLLVPEGCGDADGAEYELGLYYAARRIRTTITERHGLKGYYFVTGDERGRDVASHLVLKVLGGQGETVSAEKIAKEALAKWHIFFLQIDRHAHARSWWTELIGPERIIAMPKTEYLALLQGVVIGLTEGTLDLQNAVEWLQAESAELRKQNPNYVLPATEAEFASIVRAVSHIPMGAQAALPGFSQIPRKGAVYANRDDAMPIRDGEEVLGAAADGDIVWKM